MYLRLQRQIAVPEEIRITGVVYLPWPPGDPITSQLLRELPTARIEAAINARLFAATRSSTAGSPRAGTPTPPRPWPSSAASRSALLKAGSRELAPADSCHLDAEDAPDNERGRPRLRAIHRLPIAHSANFAAFTWE